MAPPLDGVGPWAFAPLSLSGSTEVNGSDVSVDQDLSDMLTTLDGGLTGDFAAWYRHKVGILFNASYFQVSSDGEAASVSDRQLGRLGLTRLNTDISAEGDATFSQGRFDLMFAYWLMDESQITPSETFTEFDLPPVSLVLMGGARLWTTHVDLDIEDEWDDREDDWDDRADEIEDDWDDREDDIEERWEERRDRWD